MSESKKITVGNATGSDIHVEGYGNLRPGREAEVPDNESVQQAIKDSLLARHNRKPKAELANDTEEGS